MLDIQAQDLVALKYDNDLLMVTDVYDDREVFLAPIKNSTDHFQELPFSDVDSVYRKVN